MYEKLFDEIDLSALSRSELAEMLARVMHLEGKLLARLLAGEARVHEANGASGGDRLLSLDEACQLLSCSRSYLYHNHRRLKISRPLSDGTMRYSFLAIQRAIKEAAKRRPTASASRGASR